MLSKTNNQLLQAVEQAVQEKVPDNLKNAFQRIVLAGEKVMFSPQTRATLINQLKKPGEPTEIAGEGIAKLIAILFKESKQTMPMDAAMPAAQVLLCEGLAFMEEAGRIQISNETIAMATKAMFAYLLQLFGVSQEKLASLMNSGMTQGGKDVAPTAESPATPEAPAQEGIVSATRGGA